MKMFRLLMLGSVVALGTPAQAFGDPAEAAANAWCGARANGASIEEADKQLRNTLSSQLLMSSGFAASVAGVLSNRQGIQSQIDYHINQKCPRARYGFAVAEPDPANEIDKKCVTIGSSRFCYDKTESETKSSPEQESIPKPRNPKDVLHEKCLKAVDYQGCMKYNSKPTGKAAKSGSK